MGSDPETSARIRSRVELSTRTLGAGARIAELLLRNGRFLEEAKGPVLGASPNELYRLNQTRDSLTTAIRTGRLSPDDKSYLAGVLKWSYRRGKLLTWRADFDVVISELKGQPLKVIDAWISEQLANRERGFFGECGDWQTFCARWRIDNRWDLRDDTLKDFVIIEPRIIYRDQGGYAHIGQSALPGFWDDWIGDQGTYLFIQIFPWTTRKDLAQSMTAASRIRSKVFGKNFRAWRAFERNLCWYDLHVDEKISAGKISQHWRAWGGCGSFSRDHIKRETSRLRDIINSLSPAS